MLNPSTVTPAQAIAYAATLGAATVADPWKSAAAIEPLRFYAARAARNVPGTDPVHLAMQVMDAYRASIEETELAVHAARERRQCQHWFRDDTGGELCPDDPLPAAAPPPAPPDTIAPLRRFAQRLRAANATPQIIIARMREENRRCKPPLTPAALDDLIVEVVRGGSARHA